MGELEIDRDKMELSLYAHIITYGHAANAAVTASIREEIQTMWNEAQGAVRINGSSYVLVFRITASFEPSITALEIYQNTNPRFNYFRIENFAGNNISFVDGLGSNSGYFLMENLYQGSTTAAHEFGHTLGLVHPEDLDYRGKGVPGIMYPRGTIVDAIFQYDPSRPAGVTGGTMHPMYRKVRQEDIDNLKIDRIRFKNNRAILGEFTNIYHEDHADLHRQG